MPSPVEEKSPLSGGVEESPLTFGTWALTLEGRIRGDKPYILPSEGGVETKKSSTAIP